MCTNKQEEAGNVLILHSTAFVQFVVQLSKCVHSTRIPWLREGDWQRVDTECS